MLQPCDLFGLRIRHFVLEHVYYNYESTRLSQALKTQRKQSQRADSVIDLLNKKDGYTYLLICLYIDAKNALAEELGMKFAIYNYQREELCHQTIRNTYTPWKTNECVEIPGIFKLHIMELKLCGIKLPLQVTLEIKQWLLLKYYEDQDGFGKLGNIKASKAFYLGSGVSFMAVMIAKSSLFLFHTLDFQNAIEFITLQLEETPCSNLGVIVSSSSNEYNPNIIALFFQLCAWIPQDAQVYRGIWQMLV